jgi:hypothetical protein
MLKFSRAALFLKVLILAAAMFSFSSANSQTKEIRLRDELYYRTLEVAKTKNLASIQAEFDRLKSVPPSPTGTPALLFAFSAFGGSFGSPAAAIEQTQRWLESSPNSVVAKLILLDALLNQTALSRGSTPYNNATEAQRTNFQKDLTKFSEALQIHAPALVNEPLWYSFRIWANMWQGTSSKEDIFRLVDKAQALDNKDIAAANSAINWYVRGAAGASKKEIDQFIVRITSSANNGFGGQMYFRLYNEVKNAYGSDPNIVSELTFSKPNLRAALESYYKANPNDLTALISSDAACYFGVPDSARQFRANVKNLDPNWYKNDPALEQSIARCLTQGLPDVVQNKWTEPTIAPCSPEMQQHTGTANVISWHSIASPIILCDMSLIINNAGGVGVVKPAQVLFINQLPAITAFAYSTFSKVSGPVGSLQPLSRWALPYSDDAGSIGLPGTLAWGRSKSQNERGIVTLLQDYVFGLESWRYPRDRPYIRDTPVLYPESSGSLENKPWPRGSNLVVYRQIASTRFGLNITAEQASIQINTAAPLAGVLQVSLPLVVFPSPIAQRQVLSLPLRRSVLDSAASSNSSWSQGEFRLRQGQQAEGGIVDCFSETRNPSLTKCPLRVNGVSGPPTGPKAKFSATGAFFGYQSEYLAIQLMIEGDTIMRNGQVVEAVTSSQVGTIVLRRDGN